MRALLFFIPLISLAYFIEAKADPVDAYHAELKGLDPELVSMMEPESQPQTVSIQPQPPSQPQKAPREAQQQPTPIQPQPAEPQKPAQSPVKNIFALAFGGNKEASPKENNSIGESESISDTKVLPAEIVDADQLQQIINSFPEEDQKTISAIKLQIATWPKEIFDEISAYREFVISSRKVAKQKYLLLSPEAKSALETEKQLKLQLSPSTAATLENLKVRTNS